MSILNDVRALVWKDLLLELKTKDTIMSMSLFAFLVIIIFNFAFDLSMIRAADVGHGILWTAFIFGGTLGLNRSFMNEKDNNCIRGIMLSPADRGAIYIAKLIVNLIFMLIMEFMIVLLFILFFNISLHNKIFEFIIILFLSSLGFISVGTIFSAMTSHIKSKESVLLPIILYPMAVPVIIGATKATGAIFANKPIDTFMSWINLILVYDIVFVTVSFLMFEYVIEE